MSHAADHAVRHEVGHVVGHEYGHAVGHVIGHALLPSTGLEMSHHARLFLAIVVDVDLDGDGLPVGLNSPCDTGTAHVAVLPGVVRVAGDGVPSIVVEGCLTWCCIR